MLYSAEAMVSVIAITVMVVVVTKIELRTVMIDAAPITVVLTNA